MILIGCYDFIMGLIIIYFSTIIYSPVNKYKTFKTKEDQLFVQKMFFVMLLFTIDFLTSLLCILDFLSFTGITYIIEQFIFNFYIIMFLFYNFFLCVELYKTYNNPVHLFSRIFKQFNHKYIYEFFIIFFAIIVLVIDIIDPFKNLKEINKEIENDENTDSPFTMNDKWKFALIILISLISIIICFIIKSRIKKFAFRSQEKLISIINKRIVSNLLLLIYGIYYAIINFLSDDNNYNILNRVGGCIFVLITIIDIILHLSILSSSKFVEYGCKNSSIHYFTGLFKKSEKNEEKLISLVNESTASNSVIGNNTTIKTINETSKLISNSPYDDELLSIYSNGIFIEDFWLNYFDQILNIITTSLFQIYCSKFFSTKELKNQKLRTDIEIAEDVSKIGGDSNNNLSLSNNINNYVTNIFNKNNKIGDYTTSYDLCKTLAKDDYAQFKDILEYGISNNINPIRTKVKSFFTSNCVMTIAEKNLKSKQIGASLLSHIIFANSKNKNSSIPNATFWSLTASNGKEEYFNKLKGTCLKTFDKNYNLDIFDTNDDEINYVEKNNKGMSLILEKYFNYIHGKGINGTFLPTLIGVFKIKINSFKTLLIFISRNSLIENAPKNFFTYWQLVRFLHNGPQKIASSQFNKDQNTLIKDDPIFERLFQITNDNPNNNKIQLKNFSDFQETIKNDILFLKSCDLSNFDLLLMYYEYENNEKHEKQGIIKIEKTENDEAKIIAESIPKDNLIDETEPISNLKNNDDSFGDDDFINLDMISGIGKNISANNLMDYSEKININAYDGLFDCFNCMCFFTFENIFDIRKNISLTTNYYTSFQKKIVSNFAEYQDKV